MKRLLFLFLLISVAPTIYGQTFLNGSFETNIATNCMINNITNAQFDSLMVNVRGIGATETIDIYYDTDCPFYGAAQSGHYFVSVENNSNDSTQSTAISLKLADTLQAGNNYSFCFYDKSIALGYDSIQIGVSNTDSTFGTLIYTTPSVDTVWTERNVNFTSPLTGKYITVKYGGVSGGGAFVDNFGVCSENGIDGQTDIEKLKIFPNPFTNQLILTLSNNEQSTIILYDLSSRKLLQQTFTNTTNINTEQLAKGMYLYTVRNRNGIIKKGKVIKQ